MDDQQRQRWLLSNNPRLESAATAANCQRISADRGGNSSSGLACRTCPPHGETTVMLPVSLFITLLLLLLIIPSTTVSAAAIKCYVCNAAPNNTICSRPEDLKDCELLHSGQRFDACLTTVFYEEGKGLSITKKCALRPCENTKDPVASIPSSYTRCDREQKVDDYGRWRCAECCTESACNINGAPVFHHMQSGQLVYLIILSILITAIMQR